MDFVNELFVTSCPSVDVNFIYCKKNDILNNSDIAFQFTEYVLIGVRTERICNVP